MFGIHGRPRCSAYLLGMFLIRNNVWKAAPSHCHHITGVSAYNLPARTEQERGEASLFRVCKILCDFLGPCICVRAVHAPDLAELEKRQGFTQQPLCTDGSEAFVVIWDQAFVSFDSLSF